MKFENYIKIFKLFFYLLLVDVNFESLCRVCQQSKLCHLNHFGTLGCDTAFFNNNNIKNIFRFQSIRDGKSYNQDKKTFIKVHHFTH